MKIFKIISISFIVLAIIFLVHFLTCKKSIEISINRENTVIQIPYINSYGIFENDTIKVSSQDGKSYIDILYGLGERPYFFFYDKKSNSIFVLYFFDIEMHIFAIKRDENILNVDMLPMDRSLKSIIQSVHNFNVRSLTKEELNTLVNDISSMSENKYKKMAIPTLDLGVYKFYVAKDRILEMLKKGLCMPCNNSDNPIIQTRMKVWCECL